MSIKRNRSQAIGLYLAVGLLLLLPICATFVDVPPAFAQADNDEPNPMVTMYAEAMGISYAEAERRLTLQAEMSVLEGQVAQGEPTYAGSWMQHQPDFRLFIGFAAPNGQELLQKYLVGLPWADLVEAKQLPFTVGELLNILTLVNQAALQTGIPFESGENLKVGKVTLYTPDPAAMRQALAQDDTIQAYLDDIEFVYQAALSVPADSPTTIMPFNVYLPMVQWQ